MGVRGGAWLLVLIGPCVGTLGQNDVLAALRRQAERLDGGFRKTFTMQSHAFDPDICQCRAGTETGPALLEDWVARHCDGWGRGSRCVGVIEQGVKRVAPYTQTVLFSAGNFTQDSMQALKRQAVGHLHEQGDMVRSIKHIVQLLEKGLTTKKGITDAEVADRADLARRFEGSPDRTMSLRVGVPSQRGGHHLAEDQVCECFSVTQARLLWDDDADAAPGLGSRAQAGTVHDLAQFAPADMAWPSTPLSAMALARGRRLLPPAAAPPVAIAPVTPFQYVIAAQAGIKYGGVNFTFEEMVDLAAIKYAKEHKTLTWFHMLCLPYTGSSEPYSDSGPIDPPYASQFSGLCHCMPCSNVYGEGYFFSYASSSIGYWDSSPYGMCFNSSPERLEYSPGNPCWGRNWPERTCCGSHCSGSLGVDDGTNNEFAPLWQVQATAKRYKDEESVVAMDSKKRRLAGAAHNQMIYDSEGDRHRTLEGGQLFFAPDSHTYDARLVEALYSFARQGAMLRSVKLFTTTLIYFQYLGVNPPDSDVQHLGVTLEFSKPVEYDGGKWSFLTLELMSSGLMWQFTATAAPAKSYLYQKEITMAYDNLSPKMVARFIADQRESVYRTGSNDCQTFAIGLTHRLALHGRSLTSTAPDGEFMHGPASVELRDHQKASIDSFFLVACACAVALLSAIFLVVRQAYHMSKGNDAVRMGLAAAGVGSFILPLNGPLFLGCAGAAWYYRRSWFKFGTPEESEDKEAAFVDETELVQARDLE